MLISSKNVKPNVDEALIYFKEAYKSDPTNYDCLIGLGKAYD